MSTGPGARGLSRRHGTEAVKAPDRHGAGRRASWARSEEGVSAVVSAVLIFSLFSTAFFLWTLNTMPEWIADREHGHALDAASGMSRLGAELEATPVGQSAGITIDLAPRPIPLLQGTTGSGEIVVEEGFRLTAAFANEQAFMIGNAMVAGASAPQDAAQIAALRALDVAFDRGAQSGHVSVTAFQDQDGDQTVDANEDTVQLRLGKLTAGGGGGPGGGGGAGGCPTETFLEVRSGQGVDPPLVTRDVLSCDDPTTISINALSDDHRFGGLLGRLGTGYSITAADSGAGTGRTAMVWRDTDGKTHATGAGITSNLDMDHAGSRVEVRAPYQHFTPRTIAMEGGGVLNIEDLGAAFVQEPVFQLDRQGTEGFLRWRALDMTGTDTRSGHDSATLRMTKTASTEYVLGADSAEFTLSSSAPGAWGQLWRDALLLGGLQPEHVEVEAEPATVTLRLQPTLDWTLHITVVHVEVHVA